MSKKKTAKMARADKQTTASATHPSDSVKWWREAVESIVIAIVLALLIRAFEAEAFVIPTGSMAPTLQGRHKDLKCAMCGLRYRTGASEDNESHKGEVVGTVCPSCFYPMELDANSVGHRSFTGDRILVNKFSYEFGGQPERWDVIVFKYPGNAKQNYIKRLVGLPGETVRIRHGDIYVRGPEREEFQIARKPPDKLRRLLQPVYDTRYIPQVLVDAGLSPRWQPSSSPGWSTVDGGRTFSLDRTDDEAWMRYRHIAPTYEDWGALTKGETPFGFSERRGELISDFYAYNAYFHARDTTFFDIMQRMDGKHWVGDLAVEADVRVNGDQGELLLDLVEGGWHFTCRIDVVSGRATLMINNGENAFSGSGDAGAGTTAVVARTNLTGPGSYALLFSNVDNELRLWINGRLCEFDGPTTYQRDEDFRPAWSPKDAGDLAPIGVGGKGLALEVPRLRVLRDVYYVATKGNETSLDPMSATADYQRFHSPEEIRLVLSNPELWSTTSLFDERRAVEFELRDFEDDSRDEFFPMGDNSPQSRDGRLWMTDHYPHHYVERKLLTGKAIVIYWPHPWHIGIPLTGISVPVLPNFQRMGLIR